MLIIVAHEETCAIVVKGPSCSVPVPGSWHAGPGIPSTMVSTICTCGGTLLEYRLNARGTYGWYPYENNG